MISFNTFLGLKEKYAKALKHIFFQIIRIKKYKVLSNMSIVEGIPKYNSPVLILGKGRVRFSGLVNLGVQSSPYFYNSYIHLESRKERSIIVIEDGVWINNNATIISEGEGIYIGKNTLIGTNFTVYDSDFHNVK